MFWVTVCLLCLYGTFYELKVNISNYENNAVSFVMDTTHLNWNTSFPAISVCESESPHKLSALGNKVYGEDRNLNLDLYVKEIVFYLGKCYSCFGHCGKNLNCSENFDDIVKQVRAECKDLLKDCQFNGVPFSCCHHFRLLQTEKGPCYTMNSMHLKKLENDVLDTTSNRKTGLGKLKFKTYEDVEIFLHAPEDVPFLNHPYKEKETVPKGYDFNMKFMIKEIENDPYVKEVPIMQRNCRFPSENNLKSYGFYSYSGCVVDCRAQGQIDQCNCTHHYMPKIDGVDMCNLTGLICLTSAADTLGSLRTSDFTEKKGIVCDCLPSCSEPEYSVISRSSSGILDKNSAHTEDFSKITVELESLPKEMFKRKVIRSPLELVVSMGGIIGFFLGASLLSIAEFFYYFFIRRLIIKKPIQKVPVSQQQLTENTSQITLDNRKIKPIKVKSWDGSIPFLP